MAEEEILSRQQQIEEARQKSNLERHLSWRSMLSVDPFDLPLDELDPSNPLLFEQDMYGDYFRRLRAEAPVHYCADSAFGPYWSVCSHDGCMYVDSHHETFSSDVHTGGIQLGGRVDPDLDPKYHLPMFIMADPPKHEAQRNAVAPNFTMRNLSKMEVLIRQRVVDILESLPVGENFNWVEKVSVELTGRMLATLFGIPQQDRDKLIYWSDATQNLTNPEFFESVAEGFEELWHCWEYFAAVWEARKKDKTPADDLISMLVHSESTRSMPPNEYLGNLLLLIVGGNDTTRNSISGSVLALNRYPDEYRKLKQDLTLIPSMVSEAIRWQSPVIHMARTTTCETELAGQRIGPLERVVMWYISGNRDESVFDRADDFVIDRPNVRNHLAFGFGIHRCLGNRLAEMQLRVLWEEILRRFDRIEVAGDPIYQPSNFVHGIVDLPVRLVRR